MSSGWPYGPGRDVERPFDREKSSLVIECVHLGFVEEDAGRPVGDDGAVVPGVPEAPHHVDEFAGDLVAQVVLRKRSLLKFAAAALWELVTMFHAARPPEMLCSVMNVRATSNGSQKLVDTVAPSPTWRVTAAKAAISVVGSKRDTKAG